MRRSLKPVVVSSVLFLAACGSNAASNSTTDTDSDSADETTTALIDDETPPDSVVDAAAIVDAETAGPPNVGDTGSEYGVYERVALAAGTNSATVSGGVVRGTVNGYVVAAAAGQAMTIDIMSENAVFKLYAPDHSLIIGGAFALVDPLPTSGDYLVVVESEFGNASFDLVVTVVNPGPMPETAASCPKYNEFDGDYPLRLCHKGDVVTIVQERLVSLGYDVTIDGYFGPSTQVALADLFVDGVAELYPADIEALVGGECGGDC